MPQLHAVPGSSSVAAAGYDPDTQELTVNFVSGAQYTYSAVPPGVLEQLLSSPSPGKFVHQNLSTYHYQRG